MKIAVLVLAEIAAGNQRLVDALRSIPIYPERLFTAAEASGCAAAPGHLCGVHSCPGWPVVGWSHEGGDADTKRAADTLGRAACRMAGACGAHPPRGSLPAGGLAGGRSCWGWSRRPGP